MTSEVQAEICRRIDAVLAAGVHDHLGYEALARVKLPGEDYLAMLRRIHALLRPEIYVEIGVRRGDSMACAGKDTRCIGVDPTSPVKSSERVKMVYRTSDDWFAALPPPPYGLFDLALIDGDHSYDQARRDFEALRWRARPGAVILLHDVIPMDARTAAPRCQSSFWTGDVWRLMREIVTEYADGNAFTVACPPTGLGVVICRGAPNSVRQHPETEIPDWETQRSWLGIVPNDWGIVEHLLRPVVESGDGLTQEVA